jgi:hypothetical protein
MNPILERNLEQFHLALSEGRQSDARARLQEMQQMRPSRDRAELEMQNELVGACERKILHANLQEIKACCTKAVKGSTVEITARPLGFIAAESVQMSEYMLTIGQLQPGPIKAYNASCTCHTHKIKPGIALTHVNGEHMFMLPFVEVERKIRARPLTLTFRDAALGTLLGSGGLGTPAGASGLVSKAGELYGQIASMVHKPTSSGQQQQEGVQQSLKESMLAYSSVVKTVLEQKSEEIHEVRGGEDADADEVLRRAKLSELLRFVSEHAETIARPLVKPQTIAAAGAVIAAGDGVDGGKSGAKA